MGKVMRYQSGKAAVWSDPNPANPNLAPLTNPLSNIANIKFHSDLFYPRVISGPHTGSGTIPALSTNTKASGTLVTIPHGQAAAPMAIGFATVTFQVLGATTFPLNGTIMLQSNEITTAMSDIVKHLCYRLCFLQMSSDATNVTLNYWNYGTNGPAVALPISWTIYILDLLETQTTAPDWEPGAPGMELSPTRITIGGRKFDTNKRYITETTDPSNLEITRGPTYNVQGAPVDANASTPTPEYRGQWVIRHTIGDHYSWHYPGYNFTSPIFPTPIVTKIKVD